MAEFQVDFPTLYVAADWAEEHCTVPDGFRAGAPWKFYEWQLWCVLSHYRVRPDTPWRPDDPVLAPAFHYRRSQIVGPQKALALDTPVATPSGWSTMGGLQAGDTVFDAGGRPTMVVSKSPVWMDAAYRVTFSDGATIVACGDHEWVVDRRTASGTYLAERLSTKEMLAAGVVDGHGARRFRVASAKPIDLPDVALPIPPYTLGAWLGDGESSGSRITGLDLEVFSAIERDGFRVAQDQKIPKRWQVYGFRGLLSSIGVLGNKHIPAGYLRSSVAQRWALLQGLMDTDGSADARQGKCEFTTTLPALRDGVRELLYSLGVKHTCYAGEAKLAGRVTGLKWRIGFAARDDLPIFRIARKQARLRPASAGHAQFGHRRIVSIEPVDPTPTQCIAVDSDSHTFLAGREMIPTGNTGKGPYGAVLVAIEGVGPALFAGWAEAGDGYACADHGCGCPWEYEYEPGEAMGMPWPTPLIQITATAEDQTDNVYRPLQAMARTGPLAELMRVGEQFIRLPGDGRIDVVTSSATARLGQPITFALQDETGLWSKSNRMVRVAETQRRGVAGMGGRTLETTNAWDPAEDSVAQRTAEAGMDDVFRFHRVPPAGLSFRDKRERRRILRFVYAGSPHVDLDAIEAEASEIMLKDPMQAERFFGNRVVHGLGSWLPDGLWERTEASVWVPEGARVCLGFDGSESNDWTAIRAETFDGHRFTPTYGPDARPTVWDPAVWGGSIPRGEVHAAVDELCRRYRVVRAYCDPRDWQSEIGDWALRHGSEVFVEWATYRGVQMHDALERAVTDLVSGRSTHDTCPTTASHVANARKLAKPGDRYILGKPTEHQKIDMAMADVLAHEATADALLVAPKPGLTRVRGTVRTH